MCTLHARNYVRADVVELVDTQASEACGCKAVLVRVQSSAPSNNPKQYYKVLCYAESPDKTGLFCCLVFYVVRWYRKYCAKHLRSDPPALTISHLALY